MAFTDVRARRGDGGYNRFVVCGRVVDTAMRLGALGCTVFAAVMCLLTVGQLACTVECCTVVSRPSYKKTQNLSLEARGLKTASNEESVTNPSKSVHRAQATNVV